MEGLNRATLIGNLGEAPELRYTQNNKPVLKLRLATSETVPQDDGTRKEFTQWHNVVVWGKRAEGVAPHLAKGSRIYVEGRIETRSYDKDGEKRYVTEISAQQILLLSPSAKGSDAQTASTAGAQPASAQSSAQQPTNTVEIPF